MGPVVRGGGGCQTEAGVQVKDEMCYDDGGGWKGGVLDMIYQVDI